MIILPVSEAAAAEAVALNAEIDRQMAALATAGRFVRTECPGPILERAERALSRHIADLYGRAVECLYWSVWAMLAAGLGYWWVGLLCLPLSLAGAHFTRRWRASRRRWSPPIVEELGTRHTTSSPLPTGRV